jgi:glycosyltransferase involved in cell wall biosynthesis
VSDTILLLTPSHGLGGGIERYLSTIEAAFQQEGVSYRRLALRTLDHSSGIYQKLRFVHEVKRALRASQHPVRLLLAHPNLLPIVHTVSGSPHFAGATVFFYGPDIWSGRRIRGRRTLRRDDIRAVTISNFSAGILTTTCPVSILQPGVSRNWFDTLVDASTRIRRTDGELDIVTAFRLEDWRFKGLPTIVEAIRLLGNDRVRLTICGAGPVPAELRATVAPHRWCRIVADLTDQSLAEHLAAADLFVLATRRRLGAAVCGEGFGIVLSEAQLAGTPVVAPAYGGSGDAFQPGLTGLAPSDESPEALASVLVRLLNDDRRRTEMGRAAAAWSRARFEPTAYGKHAVETLLAR